jgi:hypothetical protein
MMNSVLETSILFLLAINMLASFQAQAADSREDTSKAYYVREQQPLPKVIPPDTISWTALKVFPGAFAAVLSGDPEKEGPYKLLLKLPSNYQIPCNWQTATIYATVISGSFHIGVGDKFDRRKGKTISTGSSIVIPAKSHLFFWTTEEAIVQIHGNGPWGIHYVDPNKDPR